MSNSLNRIFIILLMLVLVSCSESLDIQLEPEVNVFFSSNSEQRMRLTEKDKEYVDLNEWLLEHKSDWYVTSGSYPGGVFIKSGSYGIQVTQVNVVLYSTTSPEPRAIYIQQIGKGELSLIKNMSK